jgi:tripeptidyl-peptidase-1
MSQDWKQESRVDPEDNIRLAFGLKQQNLDLLEKALYAVSDPKSKLYGQHLTVEEVTKMTAIPAAEKAVRRWLIQSGIPNRDISGTLTKNYLVASCPVRIAEKLLSTQFFNFHSDQLRTSIKRTLTYSLPEDIIEHVDLVAPTIQFPPHVQHFAIMKEASEVAGSVDPSLLASHYNISSNTVASSSATQSLFEASGQSFSAKDLTSFQSQFKLPQQAVANTIGPNTPLLCAINPNHCVEANLDVQYIMAVAQGAPTTFWAIGAATGDVFLDWVLAVSNTSNPPLVHSISYGAVESESDPTSMNKFSTTAQQLGTQGITIMVASGDDGVANYVARSNKNACGFNPSYPASVPYVTAVGATQGPEDGKPEIMCSSDTDGLITSGGGFSTVFDTPDYQSTVVASYLSNGPSLPPSSMFNGKGRGYPDVAALGHNYLEVISGKTYQVSGTSAASPVFAGMVSLINGLRLKAGKSSLGFLNPALYQVDTGVYNDITSGTNNCCAGETGSEVCCKYGFTASTGWDPTTGNGSPNFGKLADALLALP